MDKQEEIWRPIKGYEGFYEVSNRGRVRSVDRWVIGKDGKRYLFKGRILKPARNKWGYLCATLHRDGKARTFKVHRLVLEVWGDGNPEGKPQVNHLNEQKDMNFVENLSWATAKENVNWGTGIERQAASHLNGSCSKPVLALDPNTGAVVLEFPSIQEAQRKGFNHGNISACCLGERRSHRGYCWRFKADYDQEKTWAPVKIGGEAIAASKSMPVQALDPSTGEVVHEFQSTKEAGRKGFNSGHICACCRGERKTHKGYCWRYKPASTVSN